MMPDENRLQSLLQASQVDSIASRRRVLAKSTKGPLKAEFDDISVTHGRNHTHSRRHPASSTSTLPAKRSSLDSTTFSLPFSKQRTALANIPEFTPTNPHAFSTTSTSSSNSPPTSTCAELEALLADRLRQSLPASSPFPLSSSPVTLDPGSVDELVSELYTLATPSNTAAAATATPCTPSLARTTLSVALFALSGVDSDSVGRSLLRAATNAQCSLHIHRERPLKYGDLVCPKICATAKEYFDLAVLAIPEEARLAISGPVGRYSSLLQHIKAWVPPERIVIVVLGDRVFRPATGPGLVSDDLSLMINRSHEQNSRHKEVEAWEALSRRLLFSWGQDASVQQCDRLTELFRSVLLQDAPPPFPGY